MLVRRVLVATLSTESVHYQKITQNPRAALGNSAMARHRLCGCMPRANGGKDVQLDRATDCFCQLECVDRLKQAERGSFSRRLCRSCRNRWHIHLLGQTSYYEDDQYISEWDGRRLLHLRIAGHPRPYSNAPVFIVRTFSAISSLVMAAPISGCFPIFS